MIIPANISEQEQKRRMLAVENAIAQQELEGLTVTAETTEDLYRVARGERTTDQVLENIKARSAHVAIFRS